jgi:hypothetical protein
VVTLLFLALCVGGICCKGCCHDSLRPCDLYL